MSLGDRIDRVDDATLLAGLPADFGPLTLPSDPLEAGWAQVRLEDLAAHHQDRHAPGYLALRNHRFGNWRMTVSPKAARAPLSVLYRRRARYLRNVVGVELPYDARVGRRVTIEHNGGIVVHGRTVIGDGCVLRQGCTLGIRSLNRLDEAPVLGAGVELGAGAVLMGRVRLGDGSRVGANAVVTRDVPAGVTVVGVPARPL